MQKLVLSIIFLVCSLTTIAKESEAVDSAIAWLKVVDSGSYSQSWETASPFFKKSISSSNWEQALNTVRTPLGNIVSRNVKNATEYSTLPGIPAGEYVVATFNSSFEEKTSAIETITLSNVDGEWRVIGYFIK